MFLLSSLEGWRLVKTYCRSGNFRVRNFRCVAKWRILNVCVRIFHAFNFHRLSNWRKIFNCENFLIYGTWLLIDHHFSPAVWVWKPVLPALHSTTRHQLWHNLRLSSSKKQTWECKLQFCYSSNFLSSMCSDHLLHFVHRARLSNVFTVDVEGALDDRSDSLFISLITHTNDRTSNIFFSLGYSTS